MFENMMNFFKKLGIKNNKQANNKSKDAAKERLHLVLMQDRANVSVDFLELMKQEIIEVIKKYIDVDEREIDVRLTNKENGDGTTGAPALYANIPIINIKNDSRKLETKKDKVKNEDELEKKTKKSDDDIKKEKENKTEEVKEQLVQTIEENNEKEVEFQNKEEKTNKEETSNNKIQENETTTKDNIKSEK